MEAEIQQLTHVLAIMSEPDFNFQDVLKLTKDIVDEKHLHFIEEGVATKDKTKIMHGILGALSHYEAENYKKTKERKLSSLKDNP